MAQLPSLDNAPLTLTALRYVVLGCHIAILLVFAQLFYACCVFVGDLLIVGLMYISWGREQAQKDLGDVLDSVSFLLLRILIR